MAWLGWIWDLFYLGRTPWDKCGLRLELLGAMIALGIGAVLGVILGV